MERKKYSVYRIVTPSGKVYIGYTGMTMKERWRHHKRIAADGERPGHPFYDDLRSCNPEDCIIQILHTTYDKAEAMKLEKAEIACVPYGLATNLSCGGADDGREGGRIFWERMNADPEAKAAYLKKLSDRKLADDWTDYKAMADAASEWRRTHPREAYKMAYRAIRIANKAIGNHPPCHVKTDDRPLKERLMHKYKLNDLKSEYVTRIWEERSQEERDAISEKISESATEWIGKLTDDERREMTQKARASIDRSVQGPAASKGLKNWWAELKEDPVRYEEYMSARSASCRETMRKKKLAKAAAESEVV